MMYDMNLKLSDCLKHNYENSLFYSYYNYLGMSCATIDDEFSASRFFASDIINEIIKIANRTIET